MSVEGLLIGLKYLPVLHAGRADGCFMVLDLSALEHHQNIISIMHFQGMRHANAQAPKRRCLPYGHLRAFRTVLHGNGQNLLLLSAKYVCMETSDSLPSLARLWDRRSTGPGTSLPGPARSRASPSLQRRLFLGEGGQSDDGSERASSWSCPPSAAARGRLVAGRARDCNTVFYGLKALQMGSPTAESRPFLRPAPCKEDSPLCRIEPTQVLSTSAAAHGPKPARIVHHS